MDYIPPDPPAIIVAIEEQKEIDENTDIVLEAILRFAEGVKAQREKNNDEDSDEQRLLLVVMKKTWHYPLCKKGGENITNINYI